MTIYDIAQACNVSIATVSRVLNGSNKVSEKTRQKVLAVMNQQNYIPNPFARGLGLNSMKMIGILCTDVSDAFFAKAVSLIERDLRKHNLDVILSCTGNKLASKKKILQFMVDKHVDAIILIGSPFREDQNNDHISAIAATIPIITINSLIEAPNIYCILCDEQAAMQKNVERLYQSGYTRILYLYDQLTFGGQQKLSGYRQGLKKCGLPIEEQLICRVANSLDSARQATALALTAGLQFDAVLTAEDVLAVGSQKALLAAEKTIPIIGFNNSLLAECATPTLSSVDNRLEILCPTAIEILGKVLAESTADIPQKSVFPAIFVERESFCQKEK